MLPIPRGSSCRVTILSSLLPRFTTRDSPCSKGCTKDLVCSCRDSTIQPSVSVHQRCTWRNLLMDPRCAAGEMMNYLGQHLSQITGIIRHQVYFTFTLSTLLCGLYIPLIHLMRAGDIESNPGPNDDSSDRNRYEKMFLELGRNIPPSSYTDFGITLGIAYSQLDNAKRRFQLDTKDALIDVLCTWRDEQPPGTDIISLLGEKLRECNLGSLADKVACYSQLPGSSTSASLLTNEQVEQIKKELKVYYRLSRRRVSVDPLNFMESVNLDEIYTNLSLIDRSGQRKTPITYENILTRDDDRRLSKRILIRGEGGVGKTTLCSKIAWDWCNDEILQDLNMVLVIPLRDVSDGTTIGGIVQRYLSNSSIATTNQIDSYIARNLDKVLLVLDGFDEFSRKMEKQSSSEVIRILGLEQYNPCKVIVTTRPWKIREFTTEESLAKAYTFISIEGFNKNNLQNYIRRYFRIGGNDSVAEDLISFMEENDVIRSNMAPFPIYCAMLCLMWKDISEERRRELLKLQTFSQIFENMISFLKEHYASKKSKHLPAQNLGENLREAGKAIQDIGEIALEGLLDTTLSFPEERFNTCKKSMDICCRVGVLTIETNTISRKRRREVNIPSFVKSTVTFPHKLFQEYIAGVYLNTLFADNHSGYERIKCTLLDNYEEFRYVLYFSSSFREELGLDIIDGLVQYDDQYFCVDVAFECHAVEAARRVERRWPENVLHEEMSDHTISGMVFMIQSDQVQTLEMNYVDCGRTVSRQLAEGMCSSPVLRCVSIKESTLHNDFYEILAEEARKCQIQNLVMSLDMYRDRHNLTTIGGNFARWICTMPRLLHFEIEGVVYLNEDFFSTAADLASSCQIQGVTCLDIRINDDLQHQNMTGDLARWICSMPCLSRFTVSSNLLTTRFLSTATDMVQSCQLEDLTLSVGYHPYEFSTGRDMARWVYSIPRLSRFSVSGSFLTREFLSAATEMAQSCQIAELTLSVGKFVEYFPYRFSTGRDMARWVYSIPRLSRFSVTGSFLTREFLSAATEMAQSCQLEDLTLSVRQFDMCHPYELSTKRDMARWVYSIPRLSRFSVSGWFLTREFVSAATEMAESCQM
ncbi:uncharacterized protein [Diadema antillarum]|uniref:uncharacterized protein n=1 Tax=Diadema antillarum TaxID=105358 RepID=UPI003A8A62FD